ncbi:hypothetical protein NZ30_06720 [Xanthomonas translucens pv. undulosa]|nr:hypothetical protein NZ30_06720 [Xanthomonas translucens pv. undulosa]
MCALNTSSFMSRLTVAIDSVLPNCRLISARISDSVHSPNSNLYCSGVLLAAATLCTVCPWPTALIACWRMT